LAQVRSSVQAVSSYRALQEIVASIVLTGMNQLAVTLVYWFPAALAFPSNRYRVPNGFRVPCPDGAVGCKDGICHGLGHMTCYGATKELNPFGKDMKNNDHKWDKELCEKDSDGDGLTNGEELGDPCCLWSAWDVPSDYMANFVPSHPGVETSKVANYQKPSCDSTKPKKEAPVLGLFNPGEEQRIAEVEVYPKGQPTLILLGILTTSHTIYFILLWQKASWLCPKTYITMW